MCNSRSQPSKVGFVAAALVELEKIDAERRDAKRCKPPVVEAWLGIKELIRPVDSFLWLREPEK